MFAVGGLGLAGGVHAQPGSGAPAEDFGRPPSGEIPILFNVHHVYAKDHLKEGRVLTAIVRNGTKLVPLRSMFEQTGAGVAYDPSTRTVDVSKPGADVKVTLGKAFVVVNGDERLLDVPPMMYKGSLLVPLRVISDGMGAFVQWMPTRHVVVIRYVEAAPPGPPESTPAPSPRISIRNSHFTEAPSTTPRSRANTPLPTSGFLGSLSGRSVTLLYSAIKYEFGGTLALGKNLYVDLGYACERTNANSNAPSSTHVSKPYIGLGLHF